MRKTYWLLFFLFLSGCATVGLMELDELYGQSHVENRIAQPKATLDQTHHFTSEIQPIIENRCVVCHGCYDAPCQLKMESPAAIERGANKTIVYSGSRLKTIEKSDSLIKLADVTAENLLPFREDGFFPVLNERQQSEQANTQASLFYKMLELKQQHPLPSDTLLSDDFDVSLNRDQECPTIEEFDDYQDSNPLGGMPYGLPALSATEHDKLSAWLKSGAKMPAAEAPTKTEQAFVERWETLLNGNSAKEQLISRYIFEHIYLANLYFDETRSSYFKLVRSKTPSGEPIDLIDTRRPFDSPYDGERVTPIVNKPEVFYRLVKMNETIIAKRHMPYPLDEAKFARVNELFYQADFSVTKLPDYNIENAANPFKTFVDMPDKARYQFMLDEAQFSIMNFIKGAVCRGQIALSVVEDNFWVSFLNPDSFDNYSSGNFLKANTDLLNLPASTSQKSMSLRYWEQFADAQTKFIKKKVDYVEKLNLAPHDVDLDLIWTGDGNPNATLTVFRHFDSASVLKGFVGPKPKTAWVISYSVLERIHYLLVAGFDVFGDVSHQVSTRLYMDFLRMEGEANFVALLPKAQRKAIHESWYIDASDEVKDYIFSETFDNLPETGIKYQTDSPKDELLSLIAKHTNNEAVNTYDLDFSEQANSENKAADRLLNKINNMPSTNIHLIPQVSYVMVTKGADKQIYTIVNNSEHTNVAHLFSEDDRRLPEKDSLTILHGIVGTYPKAFFKLDYSQLDDFATMLTSVTDEDEYEELKDKFAIRRTNPNFWQYADELHAWYRSHQPESAGLLDFNRLENR